MVGDNESFEGYRLYDPTTHRVIENHKAIIDEPFPHGPPRSLSLIIYNDDYQHVFTEHASSSLAELLVDDS